MARPQKDGLDYFPLDVDIDQDDKVELIEAQHGLEGFAIVIKLLMKIYKNSYYYEWTEKEQLLFSRRVNVDINRVNVVINDCLRWGLFDENLMSTHKILSSKGIQRRYIKANERRQEVKIKAEYLLLDENEVNVYKNLVIVDINTLSEVVNVDINPQTKLNKTKLNKTKEKESKLNENMRVSAPNNLETLIAHYCCKAQILEVNVNAKEIQSAIKLIEEIPLDIAIQGIDEAFSRYSPKYPGDKIKSFLYCEPVIRAIYAKGNGTSYNKNVQKGLDIIEAIEIGEIDNGGKSVWDV